VTRPPEDLWRAVTFLAFHLHWPLDDLLDLEHPTRDRLQGEVALLAGS
jgi:hypothetical protein